MKSPVTTTLLSYASAMMQEQLVRLKELPAQPDESERLSLLMSLGFDGTKEVQAFKAKMTKYSKAVEENTANKENVTKYNEYLRKAFIILIEARKTFGPDTLLITFEDFQKLLRKYNLICGLFQDYKGTIPTEKLIEIAETKKLMYPLTSVTPYINSLYKFDEIIVDNEIALIPPSELKRFPFIIAKNLSCNYYVEGVDCLGHECGGTTDQGYHISNNVRNLKKTYLFICAPAKQMHTPFLVRKMNFYKDPFICAHTNYGVLILTRWGEEASSKIVKKYEELNRQIDSRAKELNIEL